MKRGILLVILLSIFGVATYAQTKKPATKPKPKTTAKKPVGKGAKPVAKGKVTVKPASEKNNTTVAVSGGALVDTSSAKKWSLPANYTPPLDGYYVKTTVSSAKPTAYPALREADIIFAKRVWEEIDVRERMNQYLIAPKGRLIDVLMTAIAAGELTAYDPSPNPLKDDPNGDEFKTPISPEAAKARMSDSTVVHKFDKDGNDSAAVRVAGEFNPDSILRFRIKEDWMFDKQRSVLEPRIIGIAPLVRPRAGNTLLDYQPAFWINFPEARKVLASKEIIMRHNDAARLSFDQAFLKRIFSAYVIKWSNEKDERIKDYMQGIDQLHESDRIKKTIMDYELNLWQY